MKPVRRSGGSNAHRSGAAGPSTSSYSNTVPQHRRPRAANPISPPTTIELRGIQIHFPFKPYKCQEDYMRSVLDALLQRKHALLESPTGTGKTLCLLCACLAWQREQSRMLQSKADPSIAAAGSSSASLQQPQSSKQFNRVPTIIYASRTHSQLSQVVRELRNTRYRPKHAVLGSREQMCVNPKVKKATATASTINHDCSALNKERRCNFKNKLEGFTAPSNESSSGAWYGTQPVMDMEDLVLMGNTHKVCPFYYTRNLVEDAELVLVPYNYLFDKDSRSSTLADIPWDNSIVIFDEAHNLESFCSESASFDLSSKDIGGCMNEVDRAITYIESDPDRFGGYIKRDNLLKLKALFMNLEEYVMTKLPVSQTAYRGEKMMDIFEKGANISFTTYNLVLDLLKKLLEVFMEIRGGSSKGAPRLEHFMQCLKRVFGETSEARCLAKAESYRVHVSPPQSGGATGGYGGGGSRSDGSSGRTISFWCFAPSEAMRELQELKVRSIIVTSGTLSPLESYAMELDLPFPIRLENPHIISPEQIHVRIIGKGVSQKVLNSSYERRQNAEYYIELGNTLASLSRVIPGGMLIFFPSYGVMETAIERWGGPASSRSGNKNNAVSDFFAKRQRKASSYGNNTARYSFPQQALDVISRSVSSTPWKRLLSHKAVVLEPRSSSDLPDAISEFHKYLSMPKSKGVALFGVCRGKISEGIDFAHDMCRAVIITGLPFAPSFDPKVKMKREFLDQNRAKLNAKVSTDDGFGTGNQGSKSSLSGHEWYQQQAHRAVNQAVGRVIRNKKDYGAVLLLDSRFALPGNQNGLSKWVRPHILPDEGFGRSNHALVQFYKRAKELEAALPLDESPPKQTNVARILEYEVEGKENSQSEILVNEEEYTKVAFIDGAAREKKQKASCKESKADYSPSRSYVPPHDVIATVDVATAEGSKMASEVLKGRWQKGELSSLSMSSTQSTEQPEQSTIQAKESAISAETRKSPAKIFFQIVQEKMSHEEFNLIKKSVVVMKKNTKQKHFKEFIAAARGIIQIILAHEKFQSRSRAQKPELLVLLLQLLPKHYVDAAKHCTMDLALCELKLSDELKMASNEKQCGNLHKDFVSLLVAYWFDDERLDERHMTTQLSELLSRAIDTGFVSAPSMSELLLILPKEVQRVTSALVGDLRASIAQENLKGKEKGSKIEMSVSEHLPERLDKSGNDARLFESSNTKSSSISSLTPSGTGIEASCLDQSSQSRFASERRRTSINNPYSRNPYARRHSTGKDAKDVQASNHMRSSISRVSKESRKRILDAPVDGRNTKAPSSLQKILKSTASEVFIGNANTRNISEFPSNAPKNLNCTICDRHMQQPFISECGHLACYSCWDAWLSKTGTCALCRKPVTSKSLALAVFKEG